MGHPYLLVMSRLLLFIVLLAFFTVMRAKPDELTVEVAGAAIAYWYWRYLWYDTK